jgi:hypothetical protein
MTDAHFDVSVPSSAPRGRTVKFTPERMEQIRNLVERGCSREDIAKTIGVTVGSLQVTCSRAGISLRPPREARMPARPKEASRAVLGRLKALTDANPAHFNPATPFMTNRMLGGVGARMHPVGSDRGRIRSEAIFEALRRTTASGGTSEDFVRFVAEELRRVRVDPAAPHLNLGASGRPRP